MSDNHSRDCDKINRKGFFSILLNQIFHDEPKNREELLVLIRDSEQNELIDQDTCDMLEGVMHIAKKRIKEIMIPRTQMITLKLNYNLNKCLDIIIESAHSRFPVMSSDKNYVEGFLIAKDLLPFIKNSKDIFCIKNILRSAVVVPESKYVDRMLKEFRSKRNHMAVVIDEFGAVSGLVTIEDILELIVGEIEDEYDDEEKINIKKIQKCIFSVRALTEIKEFNDTFNTNFEDNEVDTIGGLVMKEFGHLPSRGESININGYSFKVSIADSRKVIQIHVTVPENNIPVLEEKK
ncbi:CNNM family magnesium/cobalt transport protein CorC [Buchnera aphidicola]|uniref:Magnesium and cobalt efflux protein CorC n=1 Tax=Buchnera aphidicola str. USDA (Myzus persicae) TaxID=1009856 RepID=W0P3C9_BUCMP|nr:CNNM family magnesium/cobalt transport protein CorC [Buchnera aphidicola]AHG59952.1 Ybex [Buchnera aphidicola str. USDA (Myzus persicae)]AHG60532.1 Ybex [Buchnera aphidicola str. W106 (Myzus persicae)]AHG61105.1 Ybex [Buchnera aphidicola str. G002 (Myzus persicae)]AHG61677.1 Ybex [Buchnera aphidicola str. F009 (Myzus persicae)]WAI03365.1 MAG: CNNM family magnesium/cobalt transport protein CorC [Buchnera aphidicola (Myzus persicae)]